MLSASFSGGLGAGATVLVALVGHRSGELRTLLMPGEERESPLHLKEDEGRERERERNFHYP